MASRVSLSRCAVGSRVVLRSQRLSDAPELVDFHRRNAEHLRPWVPAPRPGADPDAPAAILARIRAARRDWRRDQRYAFVVTGRETGAPIVGMLALTVHRGAFQSAYLGYDMDGARQGAGLMTEAVGLALDFAFGPLGLHRVQAAILPRNPGSRRVLEKNGFRPEGLARRYLQIAGSWEDHELHAITAEER